MKGVYASRNSAQCNCSQHDKQWRIISADPVFPANKNTENMRITKSFRIDELAGKVTVCAKIHIHKQYKFEWLVFDGIWIFILLHRIISIACKDIGIKTKHHKLGQIPNLSIFESTRRIRTADVTQLRSIDICFFFVLIQDIFALTRSFLDLIKALAWSHFLMNWTPLFRYKKSWLFKLLIL